MTKQFFRRPKDIAVFIFFTVLVILFFLAFLFQKPHQVIDEEANKHDLKKILERDTLIALTDNTSFSFFIYKGQPMGYQYELLQHFSDYLGVELSIQTENNIETSFDLLNNREVDLIAIDLTITRPRKNIVSFTVPINETKQVLIQRKPIGWQRMKRKELDDTLIRNVIDLGGKTVFIQKNTAYKIRLTNLAEEIGDSINIREIDNETEDLIAKVAEGVIDYTVADYHVAMANATYYDNIDYNTPISFSQSVAWATRKGSDSLLNVLNSWLTSFTKTLTYKRIYRKYFVSNKSYHLQESEFHSTHGGKISRYDNYIKKYSKDIGWDWRLVASLIYEESRFNPGAKSWAGAYGLM
ncbi:MAG: lytic transglycosylase F, partial [Bacteroidales bacterium]|nr:lytic transglycosylase F [Bacteroidales bacterium]